MNELPHRVEVPTPAKWRQWLKKNHRSQTAAWVVFYKQHTGKTWISYDAAVEEALCYGWVDSLVRRIDDDTFARKFTPRKPGSKWSASNKKRVAELIDSGRMTPHGQALVDAAKQDGSWAARTAAATQFAMPTELTAALAKHTLAREHFEALSPSCRKQYITWIASAKKPETRERRSKEALKLLAKNQRLGMK